MQPVACRQFLVGVEVKPALPALLFWTAVPGDAECLIAAAREGDQVLLQRIDPEGVGDLVLVLRAIWSLDADHELIARAGERADGVKMLEHRLGEIPEDCGLRGRMPRH